MSRLLKRLFPFSQDFLVQNLNYRRMTTTYDKIVNNDIYNWPCICCEDRVQCETSPTSHALLGAEHELTQLSLQLILRTFIATRFLNHNLKINVDLTRIELTNTGLTAERVSQHTMKIRRLYASILRWSLFLQKTIHPHVSSI